jgi:hypothetical protein
VPVDLRNGSQALAAATGHHGAPQWAELERSREGTRARKVLALSEFLNTERRPQKRITTSHYWCFIAYVSDTPLVVTFWHAAPVPNSLL